MTTKGLFLITFIFLLTINLFGHNIKKTSRTTIPIDTLIEITVTKIDTIELDCYNVYYFNYSDKKARFIVDKSNDAINLLRPISIKLCVVYDFCYLDKMTGKRSYLRTKDISILKSKRTLTGPNSTYYNFDPLFEFPTLGLCDAK